MRRAKLGEVEFSTVEGENPEYSNEITDKAVEEGVNVADHARPVPIILPINGVVTGPDAPQKLAKLRQYRDEKRLLTYVGRNVMNNMMIQTLVSNHIVRVRDGFGFTITLKQIRIARSREVRIVAPDPAASSSTSNGTATQTNPVGEKGMQQTQEKATDDSKKESTLRKLSGKVGL